MTHVLFFVVGLMVGWQTTLAIQSAPRINHSERGFIGCVDGGLVARNIDFVALNIPDGEHILYLSDKFCEPVVP